MLGVKNRSQLYIKCDGLLFDLTDTPEVAVKALASERKLLGYTGSLKGSDRISVFDKYTYKNILQAVIDKYRRRVWSLQFTSSNDLIDFSFITDTKEFLKRTMLSPKADARVDKMTDFKGEDVIDFNVFVQRNLEGASYVKIYLLPKYKTSYILMNPSVLYHNSFSFVMANGVRKNVNIDYVDRSCKAFNSLDEFMDANVGYLPKADIVLKRKSGVDKSLPEEINLYEYRDDICTDLCDVLKSKVPASMYYEAYCEGERIGLFSSYDYGLAKSLVKFTDNDISSIRTIGLHGGSPLTGNEGGNLHINREYPEMDASDFVVYLKKTANPYNITGRTVIEILFISKYKDYCIVGDISNWFKDIEANRRIDFLRAVHRQFFGTACTDYCYCTF